MVLTRQYARRYIDSDETMQQPTSVTHLIIRPATPDDATDINAIARHPQVARRLLQLPSKELAQTEALLNEQVPGLYRLTAVANQSVIGFASLKQPQNPRMVHSATLGMMVHPHYWRQGVGSSLLQAMLDLADNWLNLRRVELSVQVGNRAAVRLYEKFGFEREGIKQAADFVDGRYEDQAIMSRLRGERPLQEPAHPPSYPLRKDVASLDVRPVKPEDAADLYEMLIHPGVGYGTNQLPSNEIARTAAWLKEANAGVYRYSAVAKHEDGSSKVVGNLTLHQHQKPRQMHGGWFGMSVHPNYWGQGIGSKLLATTLDLADNWLQLKRVELEVHTDNPGAIHLYHKFGFALEGTKRLYSYGAGRWADAHFMARLAPGFLVSSRGD